MTDENRAILNRINAYSEKVMGEIDPQRTRVSVQLDNLRPIFQEIADEKGISLEEMFILYMDIQSEAACATEAKFQDDMKDLNDGEGMPLLFR